MSIPPILVKVARIISSTLKRWSSYALLRLVDIINDLMIRRAHLKRWHQLMIVIVALLVAYVATVGLIAQDTLKKTDFQQVGEVQDDQVINSPQVEAFQQSVDDAKVATKRMRSVLLPITVGCAGFDWAPLIRPNCEGYNSLFKGFDDVVKAAELSLAAADELQLVIKAISSSGIGTSMDIWETKLESVNDTIGSADELIALALMESQPKSGALPIVNKMLEREHAAVVEIAKISTFESVATDAMFLGLILASDTENRIEELRSAVSSGAGFTEIAFIWSELTESIVEFDGAMLAVIEAIPSVVKNSSVESSVLGVRDDFLPLKDLAVAVDDSLVIFTKVLEAASRSEGSLLWGDGMTEMIAALNLHQSELDDAGAVISDISLKLTDGEVSAGLIGEASSRKIVDAIELNLRFIQNFRDFGRMLNELIGTTGIKSYLVLGQSPAEIRPIGGFTSSVWLIKFEDGSLVDLTYVPVLEFGESEVLSVLPNPPEPLKVFMNAGAWYVRDVGWAPSFPNVSTDVMGMYSAVTGEEVDGVIALTQEFLVHMIGVVGQIEVDGEILTAETTDEVIQRRTDEDGTEFLKQLLEPLMNEISSDSLDNSIAQLGRSILADLESRNLMIYSSHSDTAELLERLDWDGRVEVSSDDVVAVFDSNVGWNKVDVNIVRSIRHDAIISEDGSVTSLLNIRYENNSSTGVSDCDYHGRPENTQSRYAFLTEGCYWDYVRAYIPQTTLSTESPLFVLPPSSFPAQSGAMKAGAPTGVVSIDDTGMHFGGFFSLEPGNSVEHEFKYVLPAGTSGSGKNLEYVLNVFGHPGIPDRIAEGTISFPEGYEIIDAPKNITVGESKNVARWILSANIRADFKVVAVGPKNSG